VLNVRAYLWRQDLGEQIGRQMWGQRGQRPGAGVLVVEGQLGQCLGLRVLIVAGCGGSRRR
jgi:hypothetical protein